MKVNKFIPLLGLLAIGISNCGGEYTGCKSKSFRE